MNVNNKKSKKYGVSMLAAVIVCCLLSFDIKTEKSAKDSSLFTNKQWLLTSMTVQPAVDWDLDGELDTDIMAKIDPCEKDDAIEFRSNNSFARHTGKLKCDEEEESENETGTWKYLAASKTLTVFEEGLEPQTYTIAKINANQLTLYYKFEGTDKQHQIIAVYEIR